MIEDLDWLANKLSANSVSVGDWEALIHFTRGRNVVVELGTNIGSTSILLSQCAKQVITVDIFEDTDLIESPAQREMYKNHFQSNQHYHAVISAKLSAFENISIVKSLSYAYADKIPDESIDAIFIDADHSYQGVKRDFEAWYSKVVKGGTFLFHDVGPGCEVFDYYNNELAKDFRIDELRFVAVGPCWTKAFKKV